MKISRLLAVLSCASLLPLWAAADTCPSVGGYSRMSSPVDADYFGAGHRTVDPTSFDDVLGTSPRWPASHHPFPGDSGLAVRFDVPSKQFVSLKFVLTDAVLHGSTQGGQALWGHVMLGEDGVRPNLSMTISRACGDFGQAGSVLPGCKANSVHSDGGLVWTAKPGKSPTCVISSPGTYYLNFIQADITKPSAPVSTVDSCLKMMGPKKAAAYPGLCHTLEVLQYGSFQSPAAYDGVALNGSGGGSAAGGGGSGGSGAAGSGGGSSGGGSGGAAPVDNALQCEDGVMVKMHVDFFSPMPPSCSDRGLSAGADCTGGESCPLP